MAFLRAIAGWGVRIGPEPDLRKKGQDVLDLIQEARLLLKGSLNRLSGPVTSCAMHMAKREQFDQQGNSAKAGLDYFDRVSSPLWGPALQVDHR